MFILGDNAAGMLNKLDSFSRIIDKFKPGVFFIQESKSRRRKKKDDYIMSEHIRLDF